MPYQGLLKGTVAEPSYPGASQRRKESEEANPQGELAVTTVDGQAMFFVGWSRWFIFENYSRILNILSSLVALRSFMVLALFVSALYHISGESLVEATPGAPGYQSI